MQVEADHDAAERDVPAPVHLGVELRGGGRRAPVWHLQPDYDDDVGWSVFFY